MKDKKNNRLDTALIIAFLLLCICAAVHISSNKELQIDEVSTFFQSNGESLYQVTQSTLTGFNIMPVFYFYCTYFALNIFGESELSIRSVNIIFFVVILLYIYVKLAKIYSSRVSLIYIMLSVICFNLTIYTLTEARPYSLYYTLFFLILNICLFYETNSKDKYILIISNIIFINTFHFSGIYSLTVNIVVLLMYLNKRESKYKELTKYLFIGLIIGSILNGFVAYIQYQNSYNLTLHSDPEKLHQFKENFNSLFCFPFFTVFITIIIILVKGVESTNFPSSFKCNYKTLLIISLAVSIIPILLFIFGYLTSKAIAQTRYFIPSFCCIIPFTMMLSFFLSDIINKFRKSNLILIFFTLGVFADFFLQFKIWDNLYKSNQNNPKLKSILPEESTVFTHCIELAKRLHFYKEIKCNPILLVSHEDTKDYFKRFSPTINCITLDDLETDFQFLSKDLVFMIDDEINSRILNKIISNDYSKRLKNDAIYTKFIHIYEKN